MPMEEAFARLMVALREVAQDYGARQAVLEETFTECVRITRKKFAGLGIEEIREAYRMWAAGELNLRKGEAEMYGGQFNAAQLGKVLAAYMEQRRVALGAYLRELEDYYREQEKANKKERLKREYEENFERNLRDFQPKSWREVPFHWFETAWKRGLIRLTETEQVKVLAQARALALEEAEEEKEKANIFQRKQVEKLAEGEGLEGRAKTIARKLALFQKFYQNQQK
ncbi:MAG: hypothetical protein KDD19_09820 [Phaeodactylibacter sp.]|nr:hypothetical protein [Phaeodactylibacter sp.]